MNSGEIGFILFIVLFIGFGILKVIRSGEGGEFLSFMKMMKQGQADAFEGESKTLAVQIDGKAGVIEARTLMDILNQLSGIRESGILYLEDSGKMGRNLEFRYSSVGGDDYIEIREFAGEELIREQSINIEKNPMEAMDFISDALKSATPDTDEWWSKGEEDRSESQGNRFSSATEPVDNADEFSHESSVIVYNKSPLAASLPWLGILAFSTLLIQAQAPASGPDFFVANCFNLFFAIVLLLILISNENLGGRISVDTDKSHIWGDDCSVRNRCSCSSRPIILSIVSNRNSASNMGTRTTSKSSREKRHLWIQMETMASRRPMKSDAIKSVVRMILSSASTDLVTHCRK